MDGRASWKTCWPTGTHLDELQASRLGGEGAAGRFCSRAGDARAAAGDSWRGWASKRLCCCPRTGSGRASAGDALVKPGDIIYVHLTDAMEGSDAAGHAGAGLRRAGLADGDGQHHRRRSGDGGRARLRDSQFNRATQAERQTGSSFKPYVYTAAIEDGAKPGDIIVDGPVSFGGYTPHNYENDYKGR